MASTAPPILDRLLSPLGECLDAETARKIVNLRAEPDLQRRIDELGEKSSLGTLSSAERDEYETVVRYINFVSILQSKARKILRTNV